MAKYFVNGQCTGGSLAIEKHLNRYFHEHYYHALVSDEKVEEIKIDLTEEQERYFKEHKGKAVQIRSHQSYDGDSLFLNIGDLSYNFSKIKREIL